MPHQTAVRSVCTSVQKRPAQAQRRRLSRRRLIFLVGTASDNLEPIIGQRSLQRFRFVPRPAHPHVAFLLRRQDDRHCLWMDWFNYRVRRRRQEAVDKMRTGDRLRLGTAVASEFRPDATERDKTAPTV